MITIIICTRNRARQLESCLAAVALIQCPLPWDVVVVDNGSNDDTESVIRGFFAHHNNIVGQYVYEPLVGKCVALNTGILSSTGRILAFTDDDCYPAPDWLTRIVEAFTADPQLGWLTGRVLLHDPSDDPLTTNTSLVPVPYAAGQVVPCGLPTGCNLAFRREALVDVGGFDVTLGPGTPFSGEDWEVVARLCVKRWTGGYFPAPTVSHHHGRKAAEAAAMLRYYNYGEGAVFAKLVSHPLTRRSYRRHWIRRTLGDIKSGHFRKLWTVFRGAFAYSRQRVA